MDAFSMVFGGRGPHQAEALWIAVAVLLTLYGAAAWLLRRRRVGRVAWVSFNLAYVLVFLVALEGVTRVYGPPEHPLLEAHPTRMWKLRAGLNDASMNGLVITNADGWRNRAEVPREKPPGALRVVCIGDSWMFGFRADQDDTIPAVLEADLARRLPGRKVEVINGGVFGYGPAQALATLEEAMAWHPDVVVVGLIHNLNAQAVSMRVDAPWLSSVRSLLQRSRFYLWLRLALQPSLREWRPAETDQALFKSTHDDYADMADLGQRAGALMVFLDYRLPPEDWPSVHEVEKPGNHPESPFEVQLEVVAREKACLRVDVSYFYQPNGKELTDLVNDKYHPSPLGYHWIAGQAAEAIVRALPR